MPSSIEIEGLGKRFGPFWAVRDLACTLQAGEVLGFLGPNGAGKTTSMRMITGYLAPSQGRVLVCGADVVERPQEARRAIGYLPEGAPLYGDMTPAGLLDFVAGLRRLQRPRRQRRIDWAASRLGLTEVWHRPIETLSKGFKRRVGLAQAILHDPDVLILDEPTDGLDPNQKHEVRTLLSEMAPEKTIVVSTHLLEEVTAICTRVIIVAEGRLVADASPRVLFAQEAPDAVFRRLTLGAAAAGG